ncbi:hypothetical protein D3C77_562440 [compost metagenome]
MFEIGGGVEILNLDAGFLLEGFGLFGINIFGIVTGTDPNIKRFCCISLCDAQAKRR